MKFGQFTLTTALVSFASAGMAVAEGGYAAPTPGPVIYAESDPTNIGYAEIGAGSYFLLSDNDGDFDSEATFLLEGQSFARVGNFVLELQGTTHGSTDEDADDEQGGSFGAIGHYMFDLGQGTAGGFVGVTGSSLVSDSDGALYALFGGGYAFNGFTFSAGLGNHLQGDEASELETFHYLAASYEYQLNDMLSLSASGYVGSGDAFNGDTGAFHELAFGLGYDLSDRVRLQGEFEIFELSEANGSDRANGTALTVGVSIAIGGSNSAARDAIPFDTPSLHREISWFDEI